jgi:hypothetical protein
MLVVVEAAVKAMVQEEVEAPEVLVAEVTVVVEILILQVELLPEQMDWVVVEEQVETRVP